MQCATLTSNPHSVQVIWSGAMEDDQLWQSATAHCLNISKIKDKAYKKSCNMTGVVNIYRMLLDDVKEDAEESHGL